MKPINVLMVCTGNICRSPMAAGLLQGMLPKALAPRIGIRSAGTHAANGLAAEPLAVAVMAQAGIDIRFHRSRPVDSQLIHWADRVVVMETFHSEHIGRHWPAADADVDVISRYATSHPSDDIPDPYGGSIEAYRLSAGLIRACMAGLIEALRTTIERGGD